MNSLISKYNVPAPRYTSYPAVPHWHATPSIADWKNQVRRSFIRTNSRQGISVYIHLPFCESLCTYCACNTRITVNHKVEEPYLEAVIAEWELYLALFPERPRIRELHLGGGTPTFFSPENLDRLLHGILSKAEVCPDRDFSFEGHPANTAREHLEVLFSHGFRRVSFGIQDFDPLVQDVINRYQSVEQVKTVVDLARSIGYTSVNFDLVYGLPHQKPDTITSTINTVIGLRPDRIAFYSYAHVPWVKPGQRKFSEADLPANGEKRALYEKGLEMFAGESYHDIGMDHFALSTDPLHAAMLQKKLHRNFMGYTHSYTELMVSLGASAIGDTWTAFAQNVKAVEPYQKLVSEGMFPFMKGHMLSERDQRIRRLILNIMCFGETTIPAVGFPGLAEKLTPLENDGLISIENDVLSVTNAGRPFLRNICMCFDDYLAAAAPATPTFSAAI